MTSNPRNELLQELRQLGVRHIACTEAANYLAEQQAAIERLTRAISQGNKRLAEEIDATLAARAERDRLRAGLEKIANGNVNDIRTPLGPLHAAGIAMQWEIDAKICREALGPPDETLAARCPHGYLKSEIQCRRCQADADRHCSDCGMLFSHAPGCTSDKTSERLK